jgi:hypothetical protein
MTTHALAKITMSRTSAQSDCTFVRHVAIMLPCWHPKDTYEA